MPFSLFSVGWTRGALSLNSTLPLITEGIYYRKVIALLYQNSASVLGSLIFRCSSFGFSHS